MYGFYSPSHYEPYANVQKSKRPPILDQFLGSKSPHGSKLHVAILVKRNQVLATATNKLASRSNGASTRGSQQYIHAERNLLRSLDTAQMRGADIYVMRLSSSSPTGFMYSQPCEECTVLLTKCIKAHGLRRVFFTTSPCGEK
jgi:hypothetical protein